MIIFAGIKVNAYIISIHHLIVECFRQRRFPSLWKVADVVPVPKAGKVSLENMRPISLLPIPAKLAERFALQSLKDELTCHLGSRQFGIRKGSSTTHAIITAHEMLTRHADDQQMGAAVLICFDYSKAFDKVDHSALLDLLHHIGLPSGFCLLMKSYLLNRRQRVRYNGTWSDETFVSSGVPQGSLLGPYLFGLLISTLRPVDADFACLLKYVDDVCMVFGIPRDDSENAIKKLHAELDNLAAWSSSNKLTLNDDKTTGLVRYRGNFKASCNIESLLRNVNFSSCVRLLGVIFNENLGWKSHIDYIEKKCSQRSYILRRIRPYVSRKEFVNIYNGIIRSLIEYACPVFFLSLIHI